MSSRSSPLPPAGMSPDRLVRPELLGLSAYHIADAGGLIKLDAMENPHGLPGPLREELGRIAATATMNRYPDPQAQALKTALMVAFGVPQREMLLLGNGSDELIQILAMSVARPGATVLAPEPSFSMYRLIAMWCGLRYVGVPLRADFSLDAAAFVAAIERERPALTFLAYPNNPTGNLFETDAIEAILAAAPGLVVIDEAYHAYAQTSWLDRVPSEPGLVVLRTLSKLGLAGLRIGVLIAQAQWVAEFDKLRLPYNLNVLSQLFATRLLGETALFAAQIQSILEERTRLASALGTLRGVHVYPSQANFLLFRVAHAERVFDGLRARRVLIRKLLGSHPLLADCLRVTVGTPDENDMFLDAMQELLK